MFNRLIDWLKTPGYSSALPEVAVVPVPYNNVRAPVCNLVNR